MHNQLAKVTTYKKCWGNWWMPNTKFLISKRSDAKEKASGLSLSDCHRCSASIRLGRGACVMCSFSTCLVGSVPDYCPSLIRLSIAGAASSCSRPQGPSEVFLAYSLISGSLVVRFLRQRWHERIHLLLPPRIWKCYPHEILPFPSEGLCPWKS